jgi:V/A-type H+-transporting ATPase subunit A
MLREGFLVQSAFHEVDTYCEAEKQTALLKILIEFYNLVEPVIRQGVPIEKIRDMGIITELMRLKERSGVEPIKTARGEMKRQVNMVGEEYEVLNV